MAGEENAVNPQSGLRFGNDGIGEQPLQTFVSFISNGVDLTQYPRFTRQGFTHTLTSEVGVGTFQITLHDKNFTDIESVIFRSGGNLYVAFQYGYENGVKSPAYEGLITKVTSVHDETGSTLSIEGTSKFLLDQMDKKNLQFFGKSVSDIFIELVTKHSNLTLGDVEPTRPVYSVSEPDIPKSFRMTNQSLKEFVIKSLIPYAVSLNTGKGGYEFRIEDIGKGIYKAHFEPPDFSPAKIKGRLYGAYSYMAFKNSNVISWSPNIDLALRYGTTGGTIRTDFFDPFTKEIIRADKSPVVQTPSKKQKSRVSYTSNPIKTRIFAAQTEEMIRHRQQVVSDAAVYSSYMTGDMVIVGDPLIKPFNYVYLTMLSNVSVELYSSGYYMVQSVVHDLGDSYTTSLSLKTGTSNVGNSEVNSDGKTRETSGD